MNPKELYQLLDKVKKPNYTPTKEDFVYLLKHTASLTNHYVNLNLKITKLRTYERIKEKYGDNAEIKSTYLWEDKKTKPLFAEPSQPLIPNNVVQLKPSQQECINDSGNEICSCVGCKKARGLG